ncbi:TlpA family protein disulfide reductase [bacterium]|nr:TlpA family protein disulfide reductase [bacterium]
MKQLAGLTLTLLLIFAVFSEASAISRDWSLKNTNGGDYRLSEHLNDSPALIMFWASWCKPCKKELNDFKETIDFYADSLNVEVILISIDTQKTKTRVKPYLESKGYKWNALYDPDGEVLKMYGGTNKIPYTVLLDAEGKTQWKHIGEMKSLDELTGKIHELTGSNK